MFNNGSHRSSLLAASVAAVVVCGAAYFPAKPISAVSPRVLTRDDFTQVMQPGFGDRQNSWSWSMAYYKGRLYVGTNRNKQCVDRASFSIAFPIAKYPPPDPSLACPTPISALPSTLGAQIWSVDPSITTSAGRPIMQSDWQEVYAEQTTIPMTVGNTVTPTTGPRDMGWRGMSVYDDGDANGAALYVSGVGLKPLAGSSVPPPALLRTTDGQHFQAVPSDPGTTLGDINTLSTIPALVSHGGCCMRGQVHITDSTGTSYFFIIIGSFDGEGAVFVSKHPDQGNSSFVQLTPANMSVFEMAVFNGHLYLGVQSLTNGYEVLRTDCFYPSDPSQVGCPSSAFTTIVPGGGGLGSSGDHSVLSMHVFTSTDTTGNAVPHLYIGTDGFVRGRPAELVRVNQDDSWDLIVGKPRSFRLSAGATCSGTTIGRTCIMFPKSGLGAGFDWPFNWHMWRMEDYQGVLYVGTLDSSTLLFGSQNTALANALRPLMGFDLWASTDGEHFSPVTLDGFHDQFNMGLRSLQATPNGLFVGSANDWEGTRVYEGAVPSAALRLAPQNLQSEMLDGGGAVALAWDLSPATRVYHVYRSTSVLMHLPSLTTLPSDPETGQEMSASYPRSVWVPGAYTEIGQTQGSVYVDHTTQMGGHYSYYVVAEDGTGNLSAPSNVARVPGLLPQVTFHDVMSLLAYQSKHGQIAAAQQGETRRALWSAYLRLLGHDPVGSSQHLETLRQNLLAAPTGDVNRLYADNLAELIGRLEKRLALVANGALAASRVYK